MNNFLVSSVVRPTGALALPKEVRLLSGGVVVMSIHPSGELDIFFIHDWTYTFRNFPWRVQRKGDRFNNLLRRVRR